MTIKPVFYKTVKEVAPSTYQNYFTHHNYDPNWNEIAIDSGPSVPNTELKSKQVTIEPILFTTIKDISSDFPMLDIAVKKVDNPNPQHYHNRHLYVHEMRVALDPELEQLFGFMSKELRLRADQRANHLTQQIVHWKMKNDRNVELLHEARKEIHSLKQVWWRRLWRLLTSRQEV